MNDGAAMIQMQQRRDRGGAGGDVGHVICHSEGGGGRVISVFCLFSH